MKVLFLQTGLGPLPYEYKYEVSDRGAKDGPLQFKKQEKSDSSGSTTGQYSVLLPDGRIQVSSYSRKKNVNPYTFRLSGTQFQGMVDSLLM